MTERPPAPKTPEKDKFEPESLNERAGIEGLFSEHIETRGDLSLAQKAFLLKYMREHKQENWSRYNGKDVWVESIMFTKSGDVDICLGTTSDQDGSTMDISPPVIRFPEELKKK